MALRPTALLLLAVPMLWVQGCSTACDQACVLEATLADSCIPTIRAALAQGLPEGTPAPTSEDAWNALGASDGEDFLSTCRTLREAELTEAPFEEQREIRLACQDDIAFMVDGAGCTTFIESVQF